MALGPKYPYKVIERGAGLSPAVVVKLPTGDRYSFLSELVGAVAKDARATFVDQQARYHAWKIGEQFDRGQF